MSLIVCHILTKPGSRQILVKQPKKNFTEIRRLGVGFFYADRQTDEANGCFS